jgi:hypothetical protein
VQTLSRVLPTLDRRFWGTAAAATAALVLVLGIPADLVPNPIFGRQIAAEPFAYVVWVASAALGGLLVATYLSRAPAERHAGDHADTATGRSLTVGSLAAFLAIGCPVCNKVAVLALGFSGALQVWAPLQPIVGAASILLLGGTLVWRLRMRATGCTRCVPGPSA